MEGGFRKALYAENDSGAVRHLGIAELFCQFEDLQIISVPSDLQAAWFGEVKDRARREIELGHDV